MAAIHRTVGHWQRHDEVRHRRSIWPYVRDRYGWDLLRSFPLHRVAEDFVVVERPVTLPSAPRVVWPATSDSPDHREGKTGGAVMTPPGT